nr:unnamed protein product [Callosobruchus analis]
MAKRPFECVQCGKTYRQRSHLNSHTRYECGKPPSFHCFHCGKQFHQKSNYKAHLKKYHGDDYTVQQFLCFAFDFVHKPFGCERCGKFYKQKSNLNRHVRYECGKPPSFQCYHCGRQFHQHSNYKTHMKTYHDRPFGCTNCAKAYKRKSHLTRHIRYECGKPPSFHCDFCHRKFRQQSNYKTHLKSHHDMSDTVPPLKWYRPFACMGCERRYKRKIHLDRHIQYECGKERSFRCDYCDKAFHLKYNCKTHMIREYSLVFFIPDKPFPCTNCTRAYKRKHDLKRHLRYECGKEPSFKCDYCDKAFKQKSNYKQFPCINSTRAYKWMYVLKRPQCYESRKEPSFKCVYCNKAFSQKSNLIWFLSFLEKRFKCMNCNRSYIRRYTLNRHLRYECGKNAQFRCDFCDKTFHLNSNCQKHILKPFACCSCWRSYMRKNELVRHTRYECGKEPSFKCYYCHKAFHRRSNCNDHMRLRKRFSCSSCPRSYKRKCDLVRHTRYECGKEKTFRCDYCDKAFHLKTNCRAHMLQRYKRFACTTCRKSYKRKAHLSSHVRYECGKEPAFHCQYCSRSFHQKSNCKKHMKTHETDNRILKS